MANGKVDKVRQHLHALIESVAEEKLTLEQSQDLLRAAIVEIGTQTAVTFKNDAAAQGHQGPGPHYWDNVLALAAYIFSLKAVASKQMQLGP